MYNAPGKDVVEASTTRVLSLSSQRSLAPRARGSARGPCGGRSTCGRGLARAAWRAGLVRACLTRAGAPSTPQDRLATISNQHKAHLGRHRRALTEGREDFEANMMARARGGCVARW